MRVIYLICVFILLSMTGFSQAVIQRAGPANTVADYNLFTLRSFRPPVFSDTSAANASTPSLDSAGKMIYTYDYNGYWFRSNNPRKWVRIVPSGNTTGDTLYWRIGGNNLGGFAEGTIGIRNNGALYFVTNDQKRLGVPAGGITYSNNPVIKVLGFDTTTKLLYSTTGGSGGGGTVTSVGLSMPTAFSVTGSPITSAGTLAVMGAGNATQYIDGTGALKMFTYDATVDFSVNSNPNTIGTTFNPNTPMLSTVIYVSTIDGGQWTWNGAVYVIYKAPYWGLKGNAGTAGPADFIGTTDNQPLFFKTNNIMMGVLNSTRQNIGFGNNALLSNTTGGNNLGMGISSLRLNTTGSANVGLGASTLNSNISGQGNTAIGVSSLGFTTASRNTGIGNSSGSSNMSGSDNIFIGYYAGSRVTNLSSRLYVNNIQRTDANEDSTRAIIYGVMDTLPSNQKIYLNSKVYTPYISSGAGNKSVRYNDVTKEITFADTTNAGSSYTFTPPLVNTLGVVSINDAAADGVSKGAATFTSADFNASSGIISIDYTNAQKASTTLNGFLTSTDWNTFNGKESALTFSTGLTRSANTITNNLSTGVSGGQTLVGSTSTTSGLNIKATTANGTTGADIAFTVGNNGSTEVMRIKNAGNVGIGTASPNAGNVLHVQGKSWFEGTNDFGPQAFRNSSVVAAFNGNGEGTLIGANTSGNFRFAVDLNGNVGSVGRTHVGGSATADSMLQVDGSGHFTTNVRIDGAFRLAAFGAGSLTTDASGNVTSVSDVRLKTNIKPSYVGLSAVIKLQPITYKWDVKSGNETESTYTGFSAQNVKENIPNGTGKFVGQDGVEYLTLQDRAILGALVNSVKELKDENDKLKKEITKLKKKK